MDKKREEIKVCDGDGKQRKEEEKEGKKEKETEVRREEKFRKVGEKEK